MAAMSNPGAAARRSGRRSSPQTVELEMNRILEVTDEDESLVLQFVDLEDLRNEGILPRLAV
jgi:hypothetical protein